MGLKACSTSLTHRCLNALMVAVEHSSQVPISIDGEVFGYTEPHQAPSEAQQPAEVLKYIGGEYTEARVGEARTEARRAKGEQSKEHKARLLRKKFHRVLANVFCLCTDERTGSAGAHNQFGVSFNRQIAELPYHLEKCGDSIGMQQTLCNPVVFRAIYLNRSVHNTVSIGSSGDRLDDLWQEYQRGVPSADKYVYLR